MFGIIFLLLSCMLFSMCLNHILHRKGFFADRCPVFYIPGVPQAELSCSFPNLSFSLATLSLWIWAGGGGKMSWFICCISIWLLLLWSYYHLSDKKKPHRTPPLITKKSLTLKMYSLWSTVFIKTVLVLSEGWCAFWAYQRSVMFLCLSSVFQFKQVCFQQTNSEFVKARLKFLKAAPVSSHPNLLKFKYKMQMPFWQLWKS